MLLVPSGWLKVQRGKKKDGKQGRNGIIICFSHCCPSFYAYVDICWENEHSFKVASFCGNVPKEQMTMAMETVTQKSCLEFRGVCVKMAKSHGK